MTKTSTTTDHEVSLDSGGLSRRRLLGGALGTAAGLGSAACGPGSTGKPGEAPTVAGGGGAEEYDGPKVELAFWNGLTGGDGPIMRKLITQFNTAHPNIKVTMTAIAWAEYYQKVTASVSNGRAPDIGIMHADTLATNAARRVIDPLDDVAQALKLTVNDFTALSWQGGIYKDKRYGIALDMHPAGLFYNKTVMETAGVDPEKPPTTGDELMEILEKAKAKGIQGMWTSALSVFGPESQTLVYQFGGKMVNDDGMTVGFAEEPAIQAINWWKSLIDQGPSGMSLK